MSDWITHTSHGFDEKPQCLHSKKFEVIRRDGLIVQGSQVNCWQHTSLLRGSDIMAYRVIEEDAFMHIEELQCYSTVANVLGHDEAKRQLSKIPAINAERALTSAFNWATSAQGHHFWDMISEGKNPLCTKGKDMCITDETGKPVMNTGVSKEGPTKSDGSTASYYELPEGAKELQQLISHTNMNHNVASIFELCYDYSVGDDKQLKLVKGMLFYAETEIARLEGVHKV